MIEKEIVFRNINEGIVEERLHIFQKNLEKNLKYIKEFGGLSRIVPRFEGKNVIIAGAGPSLLDEISLLKKYQHREEIVIIATDMSLLPLVNKGIYPSYVISCETMPVDYFSPVSTEELHLLAFSCISSTNLRKWRGDISFYNWMISGNGYDALWEKAGDLGAVATASIVTTQAVSFSLGCKIKSLMITGNDMAFGTQYYIKNTVVFKNNTDRLTRFNSMETADFSRIWKKREYKIKRGDKLYYTDNQFLAAKMWLEDLFKNMRVPIYDSSIPGCSENSVKKCTLKDYLSLFDKRTRRKKKK